MSEAGFCQVCLQMNMIFENDTDFGEVWCCADCCNDLYAQRDAAMNMRPLVFIKVKDGKAYLSLHHQKPKEVGE